MRTTLTLDDDVAAKLREAVRRTGKSLKETVNDLLRTALNARRPRPPAARFKVVARELGARPGLDYDRIGELLETLEGPMHR